MAQKMAITGERLRTLGVGFKASFQRGFARAESQFRRVATVVNSTTGIEEYGWIGKVPGVREWIGDRVIQNVTGSGYAIKNKDYESTVGVDRNDIEDDTLGMYGPLFEEMGLTVNDHKDALTFELLSRGTSTPCYDGQSFFDPDHPVIDVAGTVRSVTNYQDGGGPAWYLLDDSRALKPLILQLRKDFDFTALDNPDDPNVFHRKEFIYGYDARMNAGFGFWQMAFCSKAELNPANYELARTAIRTMTGDGGRKLNLKPKLLVIPSTLDGAARELLVSATRPNGETNKWHGTAEILDCAWLD